MPEEGDYEEKQRVYKTKARLNHEMEEEKEGDYDEK